MPVILGRLDTLPRDSFPEIDIVRAAQEAFVARDPFAALFDTDDLPQMPGNLHFDVDGTILLGERFANAYMSIIPEPSTSALLSMGTLALLAYAWRRRRWR